MADVTDSAYQQREWTPAEQRVFREMQRRASHGPSSEMEAIRRLLQSWPDRTPPLPSETPVFTATPESCLSAYATCVYRRAYNAGRGEQQSMAVLEERMRVEVACRRAVMSFLPPEPPTG